ncbi:phage tail-collar fiber domain-containing protein [Desulfoluna spongiiphila]|uniref:phage tail-collar fiber domain-containing protein n=1 Tax=Desulfoluna spongiiphila TaxID=419481 RepID=UPI0012517BFB|nr:phage tail protein [Desulfoluna spongiiphila]VVS90790.1 phage tail fibre protein [Desulfoluna spongiiphila]
MSSAITALGQTRINELRGEEKPLVIDRMVLALVPGLDPSQPVDRNQQMPSGEHIVHTYTIDDAHKGYVNPDQVVYSMILGSDVGDFSFNWIGTVEAVTGNVITVTTTPETPKRKTDLASNTTGNNITRNVMMRFQDAQALTGVSVSAETWQFDYTTWMVARIEEHDGDGEAHQDIRQDVGQHIGSKTNPHSVTKDQVGLGELPNAKTDSFDLEDSEVLASAAATCGLNHKLDDYIAQKNIVDRVYYVTATVAAKILDIDGLPLSTGSYFLLAHVTATSTQNNLVAYLICKTDPAGGEVNTTITTIKPPPSQLSNHICIHFDADGDIAVRLWGHTSTYGVNTKLIKV